MKLTRYLLDLINMHRCKRCIQEAKKKYYKYNASVCAIAKNEESYLEEWIEHHLKIGFEHIYIIDNNDDYGLEKLLFPYIARKQITLIDYVGIKPKNQTSAYTYCLDNYGCENRWIAFIDVDEFICLTKDMFIEHFLKRREHLPGIAMNWKMYGADGQIYKEAGKVMDRFKIPVQSKRNYCFKSIIQPHIYLSLGDGRMGAHRWSYPLFDENGNLILGELRKPTYQYIAVNHYYTKSFEEFFDRMKRGETIGGHKTLDDFFEINDISMKSLILKYIEDKQNE
ncbi:glycosyltransferase family 2 protein [uncultured Parabacteroides sp.]|uniref:glycosyltransferase family 2 protein n=4 Tax=uncultured Parabacteroides sp. TaxID=512312 RepID=UPI00265F2ED2|nr:glycosyltransferase family 2 protein [uncultured Parabacteroides sp.]